MNKPNNHRLTHEKINMPLIQISLIEGKSAQYVQAIADGVHQALQVAWNIPKNDRFQLINEYKKSHFMIDKTIWDGNRSDDIVVIYITSIFRTQEMKINLYKELAKVLSINPGIRKEDIFVSIVHNDKDCWSFGKGIAQLLE
jgi:phenylpyruvate tautomerase PptA (4-oxalocrotonate tautomerase family)